MFRQNVHMINFPHCSKGAKRVAVTHLVEQMIVVDLLYKEGMTVSEERGVHFENHIPQTQISKNVYLKKITKESNFIIIGIYINPSILGSNSAYFH